MEKIDHHREALYVYSTAVSALSGQKEKIELKEEYQRRIQALSSGSIGPALGSSGMTLDSSKCFEKFQQGRDGIENEDSMVSLSEAIFLLQESLQCEATRLPALKVVVDRLNRDPEDPYMQEKWAQSLALVNEPEDSMKHFYAALQLYAKRGDCESVSQVFDQMKMTHYWSASQADKIQSVFPEILKDTPCVNVFDTM